MTPEAFSKVNEYEVVKTCNHCKYSSMVFSYGLNLEQPSTFYCEHPDLDKGERTEIFGICKKFREEE